MLTTFAVDWACICLFAVVVINVLWLEWMCDECTWHYKTFLVQSVYWHLAIKLYCKCLFVGLCQYLGSVKRCKTCSDVCLKVVTVSALTVIIKWGPTCESWAHELCERRGGRPGFPSLISLRFLWTSTTCTCHFLSLFWLSGCLSFFSVYTSFWIFPGLSVVVCSLYLSATYSVHDLQGPVMLVEIVYFMTYVCAPLPVRPSQFLHEVTHKPQQRKELSRRSSDFVR